MKIAIRADGGSKIGMGHIMRTLVLAKKIAKTNDVLYICRVNDPLSDIYRLGIAKIKNEGFNVVTIDEKNILVELTPITLQEKFYYMGLICNLGWYKDLNKHKMISNIDEIT